MSVVTGHRSTSRRRAGRRTAALAAVLSVVTAGLTLTPSSAGADPTTGDSVSSLRIGVLALADAISAVGKTPELVEPLPFTRTSPAYLLDLDNVLSGKLTDALSADYANEDDRTAAALQAVPGVVDPVVSEGGKKITFGYERTVQETLDLAQDDGDLRFVGKQDVGTATVSLATHPGTGDENKFVVRVDPSQDDPLLQFALVSQPVLDYSVTVEDSSVGAFDAQQGFTNVDVTGGHYRLSRSALITMRDPDGRSLLTLEDLRYSTLPDLFRIERDPKSALDIGFDLQLPGSIGVTGGAAGSDAGTLTMTQGAPAAGVVWPTLTKSNQQYGAALGALTGLSMVDGLTSLSKYTGASLALQQAANVQFPNLTGGTGDLFAPGSELLDMLATSAVAQIRCGLAPGNPPSGVAAPGDTVYCDAVPASGLGKVDSVSWSTTDGSISANGTDGDTVGSDPTSAVRIDGSNGQPDVTVELTMKDHRKLTARTMPHTVQDVVSRIRSLDTSADSSDAAAATVNLAAQRLDVAVDLQQPKKSTPLALGNPASLGALVGLTGLEAGGDSAAATATATGSSYDLGFGISTEAPATGEARSTVLLPRDASLIRVTDVGATAPVGADIPARIGFLGVTAKLTKVGLSAAPGVPAAELELVDPTKKVLALNDLLDDTGKLSQDKIVLKPGVVGDVAFDAKEKAISGTVYATGADGPATGSASVDWPLTGVPRVSFTDSYRDRLRVFDPVPAAFLHGTTSVQPGTKGDGGVMSTPDVVTVTVPDTDLRSALGLPTTGGSVEVARRLISNGIACQNFTVTGTHTLTCDGLAPQGVSAFTGNQGIDLIVAGDPFALRDGVIEGLSASLNTFDRLDADHVADSVPNDQYTSTLPLVDLTPSQLATERTDLATGLAKLSAAADEDETGKPGGKPAVSSAQEMSAAVDTLVPHGQGLTYDLGAQQLGVALAASTPADYVRDARLRFAVDGPGQVVGADTVKVSVDSSTTLATDVDKSTARSFIGDASKTRSTVGLQLDDTTSPTLSGKDFQAGIGSFRTTTAGNRASLAMSVTTDYDPASGQLKTTRSGRSDAASADLTMALDNKTIHYVAAATGTSGGSGTAQPAPEAMQVKFLAEGLDGYASALDAALDGASARNVHQNGLPVAAPLIGSHLDAGAKVGDRLTDVTSQLRDTLQEIPATTKAGALGKALTDATKAALPAGGDLEVSSVSADVTCSSSGDACDPDAVSTEWYEVSLELTLTSATKTGHAPFDIGEAGVNIKSDRTVDTSSSWSVPVTLKLTRGVGPQVSVAPSDALALDATAKIGTEQKPCAAGPQCVKAVMGYLPAELTPTGAGAAAAENAAVKVGVRVRTTGTTSPTDYSLFDLYDGKLAATASFADDAGVEQGLSLAFQTTGKSGGAFDMSGAVKVPWTAAGGFGNVTYDQVYLDTPEVVKSLATPFQTVDPYLGPARDVMDVLRAKIPVVSDLSELGGGGEISLLSLLDRLGGRSKKLELAVRIIHFVDAVAQIVKLGASLQDKVSTTQLAEAGTLLTLEPHDVAVSDSCTEVTRETVETVSETGSKVKKQQKTTKSCEKEDDDKQAGESEAAQAKKQGAKDQTTKEKRTGTRAVSTSVATTTSKFTAPMPGFSLPFMQDPNQLVDVLTGEGEASYFRIDFGHLVAEVAYTQEFGPIMAGPIPIKPFVGGSISVEGRLAVGFDSLPQTQAAQGLPHPGDVDALIAAYQGFDKSSVIREGFYLDDFEDGVDVPEVKMVTTIEAGASVSIGIVSAGIKGQVTLTINLDLHDPNHDGKVRMAELRAGGAKCAFDASASIEAFIKVFVEINLLITKKSWDYDILRFGPYELFNYECPDTQPSLVHWNGTALQLTSGSDNGSRHTNDGDVSDQYDVRQFDVKGGADGGETGSMTTYEVAAFGQVQRVDVTKVGGGYHGVVWQVSKAVATAAQGSFDTGTRPAFTADGGVKDDTLRFLTGETYQGNDLVTTPFAAHVDVTGGDGNDTIVTGTADDVVSGGGGNDVVDTGLGNDSVHGDAGNDIVTGAAGRDDLSGDAGNDRLSGGPGGDRIVGGADDDSLAGGPGRDVRAVLVGPQGSDAHALATRQAEVGFDSGDVLVGGDGADLVDGNDGSDVVVGGNASTLTDPTGPAGLFETRGRTVNVLVQDANGQAQQTVQTVQVDTAVVPGPQALDGLCASGPKQSGTPGTDFVTGGSEADVVVGSDGTDELDGGAGRDEVCGRNGDDHLSGDGAAKASKTAGENDDVMRGGAGDDRIDAGAGDDAVYGDDVTLYRGGTRVLDGTLGSGSAGSGNDYLDGADGDDVLAGGEGSDLVRGGAGDDVTSGEGRDTKATGGEAPSLKDRLVSCNAMTRIVNGYVDLNGDLLAGGTSVQGIAPDNGRFAGLQVANGSIRVLGGTSPLTGLVGGDTVVIDGGVDLDRNGVVNSQDNGTVPLASMLKTTDANTDGDCILAEDGDDEVRGGTGSDYLGAGAGTDLADGGDGNDLVLGDEGTDVLLGGPHQDVLVGGDGDDHLLGGEGADRLRGNEGDDSLVGGSETSQAVDGEDVELGGRGTDVLVAENGSVVSQSVSDQVMNAGWHSQPDVPATVVTGQGAEHFAASAVLCGTQAVATRWVTLLAGGAGAREPHASPGGPVLYDELYGGYGCDWVFGSAGDDLVRGGQDDDVVEGSSGNDTAYGDAGDDVVVGGSSVDPARDQQVTVGRKAPGVADGQDTVYGDGGPDGELGRDLLAGDNATPVKVSGSTFAVQLHDVQRTGATVPAGAYGGDVVYGDAAGVIVGSGAEDEIFGQGGDDLLNGGASDDYVEGNAGSDVVNGGDGQDDLVGGSSAKDGQPLGADAKRLTQPVDLVDPSAGGASDERDVVHGGAGHDVVLGDNGRITRPAGRSTDSTHAYRDVAMADVVAGDTSGSDELSGDDGDDVLYGQMDRTTRSPSGTVLMTGDELHGGRGNDAMVGDLAVVEPTPATGAKRLTSNGGFVKEDVYPAGSLVPVTYVPSTLVKVGGSDVAFGDDGNDTIRLGADRDLANGGAGDDVLLGGDADDALWGGLGHDRLFGGYGDDALDLKRPATGASPAWTTYASVAGAEDTDDRASTTNGPDLVYGGWGADVMQADQGGAGRQPGSDQLVDWVGNHNLYLVCNGAYGAGYVVRQSSPDMESLLSALVVAAGGKDVATADSAAWYDLGLVTNTGNSANSKPVAGAPGNNTCEGAG